MAVFDTCWNDVRKYLRGKRCRVNRRHIAGVFSERYTPRMIGRVLAAMRKDGWVRMRVSGIWDNRQVTYSWIARET